ncbi:Uncharacterised protein [Serratia ficaria]|nr:Uncharacterised protein [Serratia ficaria]
MSLHLFDFAELPVTPHVRIVVASNLKISGGRRRQK